MIKARSGKRSSKRRKIILFLGLSALLITVYVSQRFVVHSHLGKGFRLEEEGVGFYSDRRLTPEENALIANARERVEGLFGGPVSDPRMILAHDEKNFHFYGHGFGRTALTHIPLWTDPIVVIGPDGLNSDVIAHEWVHAELARRLGFWTRMRSLPVWFDEGLAMQVDFREDYSLARLEELKTRSGQTVFNKGRSVNEFFNADPDRNQLQYVFAKEAVENWYRREGSQGLMKIIADLKAGRRVSLFE